MSFNINDIVIEKVVSLKIFKPCPSESDKEFWDNKDKYEFNEDKSMYKFAETTRFESECKNIKIQ